LEIFSHMAVVNLKIIDVAFGGKGVARDNGKAIFVPYTIDGETVQADIVREKKKFGEAELIEVVDRSPERVAPECPYFEKCGGCAYQHISYTHQLALKFRQVRDALERIGKFTDIPMRPIIPSPAAYGYRNRVTVHVQDSDIGFFRRDSHRLIDVENCPISTEAVNAALHQLRSTSPREGHYTLREHPGARIFSQTNDLVAGALQKLVQALVLDGQQLLIDAYCGGGFFAKALMDKFEEVIGIDWDRFAIEEANRTATAKETYIAGDVAVELTQLAADGSPASGQLGSIHPTLIVDPPAIGLPESVRDSIIKLAPGTLIYISCNPATLARDLAAFRADFELQSVTPLDMFPQTAEIEVVAHLQARSATVHQI
jgi:tRNA/tmRNA/rRNA uracil-C5-methylase (TrmA/RlmC/RlmD family)